MKKQFIAVIAASFLSLSAVSVIADDNTTYTKGMVKCYGVTKEGMTPDADGSIMLTKKDCKKMGGSLTATTTTTTTTITSTAPVTN